MPTQAERIQDDREKLADLDNGIPRIGIDAVFLNKNSDKIYHKLREGKWIAGRFENSIRIDQPTHLHGDGQPHAHIYGHKGEEVVIVNLDGTASHGRKGRISKADADALRDQGFSIPPDRLIEWNIVNDPSLRTVIFG